MLSTSSAAVTFKRSGRSLSLSFRKRLLYLTMTNDECFCVLMHYLCYSIMIYGHCIQYLNLYFSTHPQMLRMCCYSFAHKVVPKLRKHENAVSVTDLSVAEALLESWCGFLLQSAAQVCYPSLNTFSYRSSYPLKNMKWVSNDTATNNTTIQFVSYLAQRQEVTQVNNLLLLVR